MLFPKRTLQFHSTWAPGKLIVLGEKMGDLGV